jgi:mannose/fructose/N-acetylgalactosamine-specific phosphotransferase system component IID
VIPKPLLWRTFWRTYLVGAVFSMRGMQNIGLVYILHPVLLYLYGDDPAALQRARHRYFALYHTHPWWTPAVVGLFVALEERMARGLVSPASVESFRSTVVFTLSGLGDAFWSGSVVPLWALGGSLLVLHGLYGMAWGWTLMVLAGVHTFKVLTFFQAYTQGLAFLQRLKQWNLINWAQRLKVANAVFVVLVLAEILSPFRWDTWVEGGGVVLVGTVVGRWSPWRLVFVAVLGAGWIVACGA